MSLAFCAAQTACLSILLHSRPPPRVSSCASSRCGGCSDERRATRHPGRRAVAPAPHARLGLAAAGGPVTGRIGPAGACPGGPASSASLPPSRGPTGPRPPQPCWRTRCSTPTKIRSATKASALRHRRGLSEQRHRHTATACDRRLCAQGEAVDPALAERIRDVRELLTQMSFEGRTRSADRWPMSARGWRKPGVPAAADRLRARTGGAIRMLTGRRRRLAPRPILSALTKLHRGYSGPTTCVTRTGAARRVRRRGTDPGAQANRAGGRARQHRPAARLGPCIHSG